MSAGYVDLRRPPLALPPLRRALLAPDGPLARLDLVPATGSTNSDLAQLARTVPPDELPDRSLLVTEHQQAGRGRLGRDWNTPERSSLTFSLLLRPPVPQSRWSWLSLMAGVAVTRVLRRQAGLDAGLKWPNDVLVPAAAAPGRRVGAAELKVAGILGEVVPEAGGGPAVVVGIGLNVTTTAEELGLPTATSLALAGAATTDRGVLLRAIVREFVAHEDGWRAAGGDAETSGLAALTREACVTLGEQVRVMLPGGRDFVGTAVRLARDGQLIVRTADGEASVAAGDIVHLRLA